MIYSHFYIELLLLLRRSQTWLYPLCFFGLILCLFPLAFTPDPHFLQTYLPGCLWIAALLASLISVESFFSVESEDGYLEQLLLSDTPLIIIILAKVTAQWLMTQLPLITLAMLFSLLLGLPSFVVAAVCIGLLAGTPAFIMISALAAALTVGFRQQGALLGLLILPLATPVLIFGVNIAQQAQGGFPITAPLAFLAGISLLAMVLMPWAIAGALRIGLDD